MYYQSDSQCILLTKIIVRFAHMSACIKCVLIFNLTIMLVNLAEAIELRESN